MKKQLFNRHKACSLALVLAATSSLSLFTPNLDSNNTDSISLFAKELGFAGEVKADEGSNETQLKEGTFNVTNADLKEGPDSIFISPGNWKSITGIVGFNENGITKFKDYIEKYDIIKICFPNDISQETIASSSFTRKFAEWKKETSNPDKKISIRLVFPEKITRISSDSFSDNPDITEVNFGEKLDYVGDGAFNNCGITGILYLPDTITSLRENAFRHNHITYVKIPDNIVEIGRNVFAYNDITSFDWGTYDKVNTEAYINHHMFNDEGKQGYIKGVVIPYGMFYNNRLSKITIPENVIGIASYAFALQDISLQSKQKKVENIYIPEKVVAIGLNAFSDLPVKSVTFSGNNLKVINGGSFHRCGIEGDIIIPDSVEYVGLQAFDRNNLKSLMVGTKEPHIEHGYDNKDSMNSFEANPGWHDNNGIVALYRCNKNNEYATDNKLKDTIYHVYNPIALEFSLKDKGGKDYFDTISPHSIRVERTNVTVPDITSVNPVEYDTYKLGDKLTFTLSGDIPDGYELAPAGIRSLGNNQYELTLDPTNSEIVETVSYDDTYKAGYKKTTIRLKEKIPAYPSPAVPIEETSVTPAPTPGTDTTPVTPSIPTYPSHPSTDIDVEDQDTPKGEANIDDDTTPQGETKDDKNVKADKTDEIAVADDKTPQGSLPRTGGSNENVLVLLGASLLGLGVIIRRKTK